MIRDAGSSPDETFRHRQCLERLPWLANDTLDAQAREEIAPHLAACPACREELASLERLRDAMRADDAIVLAPQAGLQKLMQRIDADELGSDEDAAAVQLAAPRAAADALRRRWLAVAAAAPIIALGVVAYMQVEARRDELERPRFETLTSDARATFSGPVVRIVFQSGVTLTEMNAILREVDAQIVAGPSEAGVYTLVVGAGGDADTMDATLARLRADPRVLFAEAAQARSAP